MSQENLDIMSPVSKLNSWLKQEDYLKLRGQKKKGGQPVLDSVS